MVKWTFQRLSDLQLGEQKVTAWITWQGSFSMKQTLNFMEDIRQKSLKKKLSPQHLSHEKNPALLSMKYWLIDRDPYFMVCYDPHRIR